ETDFGFFQEHPFVSFLLKMIYVTVIISTILLFSKILIRIVQLHFILIVGFITGFISSSTVLTFILLLYLLSSSDWKTDTMGCISMGMHAFLTGFLFPVLYRWFNKKPLFNEHFY